MVQSKVLLKKLSTLIERLDGLFETAKSIKDLTANENSLALDIHLLHELALSLFWTHTPERFWLLRYL